MTTPQDEEFAGLVADAAREAGGLDASLLASFPADLVRAVQAGRVPNSAQRRRYRVQGQLAARQGVALRALLQLYLSATWRLWPVLVRESGAEAAGTIVLRALDDTVAALTEGFQLARRGLVREQEAARREFVDELLTGSGDAAVLVPRAAAFGVDLSGPHAVAVVRTPRPISDVSPLAAELERAVQGSKGDADVLVAGKGGDLVVVFAAPQPEAVDEVAQRIGDLLRPLDPDAVELRRRPDVGEWQLGVGRPGQGPSGVRRSYREAREAMATAARLGLPGPVHDAAKMLVYRVLLRDRDAIAELVESLLGPLTAARGGAEPLLDTLRAYFATGANAVRTARRLHLSVRAVTYRLERVARLTGHDPTDPGERFALQAAVLGAQLLGWPPT